MSKAIVIKGRVTSPRTIELDEPLPNEAREVEVHARLRDEVSHGKLSDYLKSLPPGTRSKEDIDAQINEERDSWS